MEKGLCQDDPRYLPRIWTSDSERQRAWARSICSRCPLLAPCRRYAIEDLKLEPDYVGARVVVGGLYEWEIKRIRYRQGRHTATGRLKGDTTPGVLHATD